MSGSILYPKTEGSSRDASGEIALELERPVSRLDFTIADNLRDFIEGQLGRKIGEQLPLPFTNYFF